jgi:hypothetical protein
MYPIKMTRGLLLGCPAEFFAAGRGDSIDEGEIRVNRARTHCNINRRYNRHENFTCQCFSII